MITSPSEGQRNPVKLVRITTVAISMNIILRGQLAFMRQYFDVVGITAPDDKHFHEIAGREGIRMIPLSLSRTISPLADLKAIWHLYKVLRVERPHIVHTHSPKGGLIGMIAARLAGVPVRLHTVGGMPLMEVRGLKRLMLERIERLKDFILKSRFCSESKCKVLANGGSNGINVGSFDPQLPEFSPEKRAALRNDLGIQQDIFLFCFVGHIAQEKGIVELLNAVDQLKDKHKIKVLLLGLFERSYGGLSQDIRKRILDHSSFVLPGRADDVRPYYAISDAFVFPTYREGFPNALLEAGAMGLPSIATNINGCNEIVEHGKNGLLIEPKSVSQLENAMCKLLEDKQLYLDLKSNARQYIVSRFSNQFVWDAILNEYRLALKKIGVS
jgi:glycosyltransferase involved in cell wall biosynthesis